MGLTHILASMTQNATQGDNTNLSTEKGFFSVWEKLAARDPKFGHPEKFDTNVEKTKWMSAMVTVKGYKQFCASIREKYGYPKDCVTGAISIMDSSWDISFVLYDKYYAAQTEDEDILWFDGLWGEHIGDYVKKPMAECTGEEVMQEFLYHLSMLDQYDELIKHTYVSLTMMPYITSPSSCSATARATAPTSSPRAARITPSWDSMWSWTATWCSPWKPVCAPP